MRNPILPSHEFEASRTEALLEAVDRHMAVGFVGTIALYLLWCAMQYLGMV